MAIALEQVREALAAPTVKGLAAAVTMVWASAAQQATDAFLASFLGVVVLYTLDGLLGTWVAVTRGEFSKARLSRWISKFFAYSGLVLTALVAGSVAGVAAEGIGLSIDGLGAAYILAGGVNVALIATDGISILGHVDTLTDGRLAKVPAMGLVRQLLEQMRDRAGTEG